MVTNRSKHDISEGGLQWVGYITIVAGISKHYQNHLLSVSELRSKPQVDKI